MKFEVLPPSNARSNWNQICEICNKKLKQFGYYRIDGYEDGYEESKKVALICSETCVQLYILKEM